MKRMLIIFLFLLFFVGCTTDVDSINDNSECINYYFSKFQIDFSNLIFQETKCE